MTDVVLSSTTRPASVLVVDDDPMLADLLSEWVAEKWECHVARGGEEALEVLDGNDVVLLDRRMPDLSGDEVLERIRDTTADVQVLMVSSIEPGFDILDMPFDDYLRKPVDRPTLQEAIEGLLVRRSYHPDVQQFFAAMTKIDWLEATKSSEELAEHEAYLSLRARADELRQKADATLGQVTEHVEQFHDVNADD